MGWLITAHNTWKLNNLLQLQQISLQIHKSLQKSEAREENIKLENLLQLYL